MSDSHRHSRRSSTSHRTSSARHSSLRNLAATLSSSTNRSSSSVNRVSGGSGGSNRHASGSSNSGGASSSHRSSGGGSSSNPSNPNPSTIHTANQIYGATARGASTSRFSLTDQFAATRSVYDFGFDDAASSVFDTASIFSVGTARAPSTRTPSIAPSSGWDHMDASTHSYGSSVGGDTVMLGYSALLEEDEDEMRLRQQLQQRQSDDDDDDDEEEEEEEGEETEDDGGQHTPKQSDAGGDSKVKPEKLGDELLQLQEDQLLQATLPGDVQPTRRTYYELLCLARHPPPQPGQIRAAYFRLFRLLNNSGPSGFPKALQPTAAFYFAQVQVAFETLIDPARRLEYDRYLDDAEEEEADDDSSSDTDSENEAVVTAADLAAGKAAEEEEVRRLRDLASKQSFQTATDMGIRYDASRLLLPLSLQQSDISSSAGALSSVDYSLTQSAHVGLPRLGRYTELGIQQLQRRACAAQHALQQRIRAVRTGQAGVVTKKTVHQPPPPQPWPVFCSTPIVGVSASTYAVTSTFASIRSNRTAPLSSDRHQPLLPEVLAPARMIQLADTRSTGRVVLHYRQEFAWGTSPNRLPPTVADVEAEVLPRLSMTTRVSQTIPVTVPRVDEKLGVRPGEPVHVEVMVHDGKSSSLTGASDPRVGLGLSRRMGRGSAFVCADSGNGWVQSDDGPDWTSPFFVPFISPMLEVGYSLSPHELGMHAGRSLTGPADRGLKGVEEDLSVLGGSSNFGGDSRQNTWTASAALAGPMMLAGYLRYGRTLSLTPWKLGAKTKKAKTTKADRTVRVEAEVCASRFLSDGYVAVRGLAPVRWWGARSDWTSGPATSVTSPRLGLEVAMSAGSGSVHVSLYWSRASQRVKLPFLLLPASAGLGVVSRLFLWAVTIPAAVLATREVVHLYRRTRRRLQRKRLAKQRAEKPKETEKKGPAEMDFDEEQAIARHRTEADELTMVLSSAVDARSRKINGNGNGRRDSLETKAAAARSLVILSAKYGVAQGDDDDEDDDDDDDDDNNEAAKLRSFRSHQRYNSACSTVSMATRNGWAPEFEVADVTAAVAALVVPGEGGSGNAAGDSPDSLYIPRGVRKSRLLGFWDPAPHFRAPPTTTPPTKASGQRKVLHVRYLWRGKERIAEVGDGDALRLP